MGVTELEEDEDDLEEMIEEAMDDNANLLSSPKIIKVTKEFE